MLAARGRLPILSMLPRARPAPGLVAAALFVARVVALGGWLAISLAVHADQIQTNTNQITNTTTSFETTPTIGADTKSSMVVYTLRQDVGGVLGPGDIMLQRVKPDGSLFGDVIRVSQDSASNPTDDELNDVSGRFVVYTAFDSTTSTPGDIKLFDLQTFITDTLVTGTTVREARIHGNIVVWITGDPGATHIDYVDLTRIPRTPVTIAGPNPPVANVEIGSRYVVWDQTTPLDPTDPLSPLQEDVFAYDIKAMTTQTVANDVNLNERQPATAGDWVVWESIDVANNSVTIELANLRTGARRTIVDNGARAPSIDGDFVAYQSDINGNFDIFLYRISDATTFQVTNDPVDQVLVSVFDDLIAYVDTNQGADVHLALEKR